MASIVRGTQIVFREVSRLLRSPRRIYLLADRNAWTSLRLRWVGVNDEFEPVAQSCGSPILRRKYASYDAYVAHQRSKLDMLQSGARFANDGTDLAKYDAEFRAELAARLGSLHILHRGMSVLCLAARLGTEVKAFIDHGCFAIGIDLNPGVSNRLVLTGDFHDIVFADRSIDVIYTNSLDHSFDLKSVLAEVRRLLKDDGFLLAEVQLGEKEGGRNNTGRWESVEWESVMALTETLKEAGFSVETGPQFTRPWPGRCLVARKSASPPQGTFD